MRRMLVFGAVLSRLFAAAAAEVPFDLTVLHQNTSGVFAVGDIDGDGRRDIVSTNATAPLVWYQYPGLTEHTVSQSAGKSGGDIHAVDIDLDGDLDILYPDDAAKKVTWFENPGRTAVLGASSWTSHDAAAWSGGGWAHDFKIGDFNDDGKVDAVMCRNEDGTPWHLFIQNSPSSWTTLDIEGPANNGKEGTWVDDIDDDGRDDITDGVKWVKAPADPANAGAWTSYQIGGFACGNRRACVADLNGDGHKDIVVAVAEYQACNFKWFEGPADPASVPWTEHVIISEAADWNFHTLRVGDIDLDGSPDIVVGTTHGPNTYPKLMKLLFNADGSGDNWYDTTWVTQYGVWQGVLGDVGSDGDLDILTADYGTAQLELWVNGLKDGTTGIGTQRPRARGVDEHRSSHPVSVYDLRGRLLLRTEAAATSLWMRGALSCGAYILREGNARLAARLHDGN
jgi:hypothetical protein